MARDERRKVSTGDGRPQIICDAGNDRLDSFSGDVRPRHSFAVPNGSVFSGHPHDD